MAATCMTVSAYQGLSDAGGDVDANVATIERVAELAGRAGAQLVLFPELFLTGYDTPAELLRGHAIDLSAPVAGGSPMLRLKAAAATHRVALAVGYSEKQALHSDDDLASSRRFRSPDAAAVPSDDQFRYFNSLMVIDQTGYEADVFDAGDAGQLRTFELDGVRIGVLICYDVEFPEAARSLFVSGAEVLLVPTALAFPNSVIPKCVVPCRAMENLAFVVYANFAWAASDHVDALLAAQGRRRRLLAARPVTFAGLSAIVGPDGEELARAGPAYQGLLTSQLDMSVRAAYAARNPYHAHRLPGHYSPLLSSSPI